MPALLKARSSRPYVVIACSTSASTSEATETSVSPEAGRPAGVTDCPHRLFAALSIVITDHNPRAFASKSHRRRAADSGTAAGHQCDLAVKFFQEGASKK